MENVNGTLKQALVLQDKEIASLEKQLAAAKTQRDRIALALGADSTGNSKRGRKPGKAEKKTTGGSTRTRISAEEFSKQIAGALKGSKGLSLSDLARAVGKSPAGISYKLKEMIKTKELVREGKLYSLPGSVSRADFTVAKNKKPTSPKKQNKKAAAKKPDAVKKATEKKSATAKTTAKKAAKKVPSKKAITKKATSTKPSTVVLPIEE